MKLITGKTIEDAWRNAITACWKEGVDYEVKGGSYVGQIRRQFPAVIVRIEKPWIRPLAVSLPPPFPPPTSEEKIEYYFVKYLMSNIVEKNEDYTYGTYITGIPEGINTSKRPPKQNIETIIDILNETKGNTNQACISVGGIEATVMADPPCLRVAHFTVVDGRLVLNVFFRSWDLFAGFPENIGGLQLLKEYVHANLTFSVDDGAIHGFSSGLHLYSQYFPIIESLVIKE